MIDFVKAWCNYSGDTIYSAQARTDAFIKIIRREWKHWRADNPDTDPIEFYAISGNMIYDLLGRALLMQQEKWPKVCADWLHRYNCETVLDYGCGVGAMGLTLQEKGFDVILSDIPSESAEFVKTLGDFVPHDKILAPDSKYRFDAIICLEVLEHIPDPLDAARRLLRLLNKGGIFFASWSFPKSSCSNPLHLETDWDNESFKDAISKEFNLTWENPGDCWAQVLKKGEA